MLELQYVLDANIFIEASQRYYSFDFGTKFWDFLVENGKKGVLCSIDKVLKEIQKGDKEDPLRKWAEKSFSKYFLPTNNDEVLKYYIDVINFVNNKKEQYSENAINEFLQEDNADAWVIAYAKYRELIVVTHEVFNPNSKKRVLIPNVCKEIKIEYIDTFAMLKKLNFTLS